MKFKRIIEEDINVDDDVLFNSLPYSQYKDLLIECSQYIFKVDYEELDTLLKKHNIEDITDLYYYLRKHNLYDFADFYEYLRDRVIQMLKENKLEPKILKTNIEIN